jgi:threonine dehydratase
MFSLKLSDFEEVRSRIAAHIKHTPLLTSRQLSERTGFDVRLKAEMFQRVGSYKIRGPLNKFALMPEEQKKRGVVCSSAGNHAQGVALAAKIHGIRAVVCMAENATPAKIAATRGYGAEVVLHGTIWDEANEKAKELVRTEGLTYVHPFDDEQLIAGQGTLGLEIVQDWPEVDAVIVPIGGGGLISGVSMAMQSHNPKIRVIGVESSDGPAMKRSIEAGHLETIDCKTIIDGLRVRRVGEINRRHCGIAGQGDLRRNDLDHGAMQARGRRRRRGASRRTAQWTRATSRGLPCDGRAVRREFESRPAPIVELELRKPSTAPPGRLTGRAISVAGASRAISSRSTSGMACPVMAATREPGLMRTLSPPHTPTDQRRGQRETSRNYLY